MNAASENLTYQLEKRQGHPGKGYSARPARGNEAQWRVDRAECRDKKKQKKDIIKGEEHQ
jgi:hypothetical protein